jgi:rSAM/selenodomain-associated transferase 1
MVAENRDSSSAKAVLVFTKKPEAGKVKTRLIPALGAEGAFRLYTRLLSRQIQWLASESDYAVQLWVTPTTEDPLIQSLADDYGLDIYAQQGRDLGERMYNAARAALQQYHAIVLLGVDCPALTAAHLEQTFHWLEAEDAVLGPAEDGGYVLLGLKAAATPLFTQHNWGAGDVAETTREAFRRLGWRWRELPRLWDLDRPQDLARLETLDIMF